MGGHPMKNALFFLVHSALISTLLAVSAAGQSPMSTSSVASINNLKNAAFCFDTSVSANTITCSTAVGFTGYDRGQGLDVLLANTVTGATTINVNGLGAKAVTYNGTNALTSSTGLVGGGTYRLEYDGTRFVLQGVIGAASACPAGSAGEIQFYVSAGVCGGDTQLLWDNVNKTMAIGDGGLDVNTYLNNQHNSIDLAVSPIPSGTVSHLGIAAGDPAGYAIGSAGETDVNDTSTQGILGIYGLYGYVSNSGSGTIADSYGAFHEVDNFGSGVMTNAWGSYNKVNIGNGSGGATNAVAVLGLTGGTGTNQYSFWGQMSNGTFTNAYHFYGDDMAGVGATNAYYEWFDSRGVRRVRDDATFDSTTQAIEALYNPQFTKYTPGAVDFERVILGQWNGNVAEIGTEKGGTGTLRRLRFIGLSDEIPTILFANLGTPGNATENYCSDCQPTSGSDPTAIGGGTGCFVGRVNSAWITGECN